MYKLISRFISSKDGNVAVLLSLSFFALFLAMGTAIDVKSMHKNREDLQRISDAAALAAVNYQGTTEEKKVAFQDFLERFAEQTGYENDIVTTTLDINENSQTVSLSTNLTSPHELSFLSGIYGTQKLGVSSSVVAGNEDIEVVLVIDISSSMAGARLTEAKKSAEFFVKEVLSNQPINGTVSVSLVPFGGTVRVPKELSYLLQSPSEGIEEYSKYWIDEEWNQCFEYTIQQVKDGISVDGSYKVTPDFYSWHRTNPWCPRAGNEFIPLTDDAEKLTETIEDLSLSDGTGSDHGMMWAYENLNSVWKDKLPGGLENTPAEFRQSTKKIIVFMTDGGITAQHYLRDQYMTGSPIYFSRRKVLISLNNTLSAYHSICDKAKADDIEIYTIGYNLRRTSQETQLRECATSNSHYLDAFSGNLESVFRNIAAAISPIRISS